MDLNIRPRKNTYTALTQPRQPRRKLEPRDRGYQTPVIDNNINTPIIEQTPMSEPENNSNVTTSTYIARNIKTGVEVGFDNIRILSRTLNLTPIEINDVLDGVKEQIKGWTIIDNSQVNTNIENNVNLTQTSNDGNSVKLTQNKNSQVNIQVNTNKDVKLTHTGGRQKINISAINITTNEQLTFESITDASETLNIAKTSISACINGRRKSACGWKFSRI